MKDKILSILRENMDDDGNLPHAMFDSVADEMLGLFIPKIDESISDKCFKDMLDFGQCAVNFEGGGQVEYLDADPRKMVITNSTASQTAINKQKNEADYLEMFNRIKKSFCEKRNMKFTPTRVVSKPSQLHARLRDYTMDEIGKVIYGAFSDNFHVESKWKWVTTSYVTRCETIEKYLV